MRWRVVYLQIFLGCSDNALRERAIEVKTGNSMCVRFMFRGFGMFAPDNRRCEERENVFELGADNWGDRPGGFEYFLL